MKRTLTLVLLLAACGGKDKPASSTTTVENEHHEGGGGEAEEHANLGPEMKAFHDLLAPRWHAAKGPQRTSDTCAARNDFKAAAGAIAQATPPIAANADTWTAATRALVAAVDDLDQQCTVRGDGNFDAVFAKVHESFHALMEQGDHAGGGKMQGAGDQKGPGHDDERHHMH